MSRTQAIIQGDTPQADGTVSLLPGADFVATSASGATTLFKIATGEFSLRAAAASAYVIFGSLGGMIFRTGIQDDLQSFFGSSRAGGAQGLPIGSPQTLATASTVAGSSVSITVLSTVGFLPFQYVTIDTVASGVQEFTQILSITSPTVMVVRTLVNSHTAFFPVAANLFTTYTGATGRPPFTGASELTPVTVPRPKGISFLQLSVIYQVTTTAITVPTVGLFATQYFNNAAPVTTTLIAQATNGLQTATQAQPYVIPVPVPIAAQNFIVTPNTQVSVEFDFTNSTGTVDILAFILTCKFNYT
jgi:hypothetical protein